MDLLQQDLLDPLEVSVLKEHQVWLDPLDLRETQVAKDQLAPNWTVSSI